MLPFPVFLCLLRSRISTTTTTRMAARIATLTADSTPPISAPLLGVSFPSLGAPSLSVVGVGVRVGVKTLVGMVACTEGVGV